MSNNKQQSSDHIPDVGKKVSSVEWFSNQVYELFEQYSEGNFDRITLNKLVLKATEQAKAMHKEEITQAWKKGDGEFDNCAKEMSLEYYNETYANESNH